MGNVDRPEDLEQLADDLMWAGDIAGWGDALERAYSLYADAGNGRRAGFVAIFLMDFHSSTGNQAVAGGWYQDAVRLLANEPDCAEKAYLLAYQGMIVHGLSGNTDQALELLTSAVQMASLVGEREAEMVATAYRGRVLTTTGHVAEGMACLDEAMTSAVRGEIGRTAAGFCFCMMLNACKVVGDFRRAAQWIEEVRRREATGEVLSYPGECRLHHAGMLRMQGAWAEALEEAERAAREMAAWPMYPFPGEAEYEVGMLKLVTGDLTGADDAFRAAHARGRDPQPGLSLLSAARGDLEGAATSITTALAAAQSARGDRSELISAAVEISIEVGDLEAAERATSALERFAEGFSTPPARARTVRARGAMLVARGEAGAALPLLTQALAEWRELQAPYEAARTRCWLARAYREAGDVSRAGLELGAAKDAFERLGATLDARRAGGLAGERIAGVGGMLTPRELEVLRLVAAGHTNKEIADELVVSVATVERHVANIYRKIGARSRVDATRFAFDHGLARSAAT